MNIKINNIANPYYTKYPSKYCSPTTFKGKIPTETITHYNLGMMPDGIVGKVRILKRNGQEAFLNVDKFSTPYGNETYLLKDNLSRIIGEIDMKIKKVTNDDSPCHVFVEFVCNHSNPKTEYYTRGLEEYQNIGTRLLQIAQRRSDEAECCGNIQLSSKNSAKDFYKKLGFKEKLDWYGKPTNNMYLPPEAKEPLSKRYGGL